MAKKKQVKNEEKKKSIWGSFMTYCHGVKTEFKRVHWTTKSDLARYSIATLTFVIVFSLFFYGINALYALIHALVG
ncbi:MAG: preprotein translocase subunit SecE [Bacilli bacterium]|nr:preprotein translocase subunit SecE [Bacilli bacterium]